jgi:ribulose-phosphate 3-epimerase
MSSLLIAASVLAADPACLGDEIGALEAAGVDLFHLDIMDGHFVPNLTFGPHVVKALRKFSAKEFDVHLMVTDPAQWIDAFADAGANAITFHAEVVTDIAALAQTIRAKNIKAGLAFNPATPITSIDEKIFALIDRVLIMTVNPGFGGQAFIDQSDKINQVAALQKKYDFDIMVDGGITLETAKIVAAAGANLLVSGNALMKSADRAAFIAQMKQGQS